MANRLRQFPFSNIADLIADQVALDKKRVFTMTKPKNYDQLRKETEKARDNHDRAKAKALAAGVPAKFFDDAKSKTVKVFGSKQGATVLGADVADLAKKLAEAMDIPLAEAQIIAARKLHK